MLCGATGERCRSSSIACGVESRQRAGAAGPLILPIATAGPFGWQPSELSVGSQYRHSSGGMAARMPIPQRNAAQPGSRFPDYLCHGRPRSIPHGRPRPSAQLYRGSRGGARQPSEAQCDAAVDSVRSLVAGGGWAGPRAYEPQLERLEHDDSAAAPRIILVPRSSTAACVQ
jgi:hypothetical protein